MTKKNFSKILNPADQFLDAMSDTASTETKQTANPKGKVAKNSSESRSQHASILLTPTTAKSLKFIAKFEDTSVNEIANKLLDDYVAQYRKKPEQASKLDQALKLFS